VNNLVQLIKSFIPIYEEPVVYISGGLDSTIILHHLREKISGPIYTYTVKFNCKEDECDKAQQIADTYSTIHKVVEITGFLKTFPEILRFFDTPRYNLWPYWLAKEVKRDNKQNVYIGEGADEQFGGYSDRSYLVGWADQFNFKKFTYEQIHTHFKLNLITPYINIPWNLTANYYSPQCKSSLRVAYKDILSKSVWDITKSQPPAFIYLYWKIWNEELGLLYPNYQPKKISDIKKILQYHATKIWLEEKKDVF